MGHKWSFSIIISTDRGEHPKFRVAFKSSQLQLSFRKGPRSSTAKSFCETSIPSICDTDIYGCRQLFPMILQSDSLEHP